MKLEDFERFLGKDVMVRLSSGEGIIGLFNQIDPIAEGTFTDEKGDPFKKMGRWMYFTHGMAVFACEDSKIDVIPPEPIKEANA